MAERRMFAKSVIGSARFLKMPATSRLLYFDLGMEADDDGFVEAFGVIRKTGATEDDLRVLASRGFVKVVNEDLVSYITDWKQNNYIRPDRYKESIFHDCLVQLENGLQVDNQMTTIGIPAVAQTETQVRLGKDSVGKGSIESTADKPPHQASFDFQTVQELYNRYCPSLPRCTKLTEKRKKSIRSCIKEKFTMADFEAAFKKAEASSFLTGNKPGSSFRACFDWLTNPSNLAKVLEGNYDDMEKKSNGKTESKPLWTVGTTV